MHKPFMLIALIALGIVATLKQAQAYSNSVYFKDRYSNEVKVGYSGTIENPRSIWFKSSCAQEPCNSDAFHQERLLDLARAMKRNAVYQYTVEENPCPIGDRDCSSLETHTIPQENVSVQRSGTLKSFIENFAGGVATGVGAYLGDSSARALAKGMASGQGTDLKVIIIKGSNNKPVGACIMTNENECSVLDEVVFSNGEDGTVTAGMLVDPASSWGHQVIMVTLMDYMRQIGSITSTWRCRTVGSSINGGPVKWSIACGYWP